MFGQPFGSPDQGLLHMAETHSWADLKKHYWSLWLMLRVKAGIWDKQKEFIQFHLQIQTVVPAPPESALSGRSSGPLPNSAASWRLAVAQSNPHVAMLMATRDYLPALDPPYKPALGPNYTVCRPDGTQHVIKHDLFSKKVLAITDVLSFLRAR